VKIIDCKNYRNKKIKKLCIYNVLPLNPPPKGELYWFSHSLWSLGREWWDVGYAQIFF